MKSDTFFHRMTDNAGILTTVFWGDKSEMDEVEKTYSIETNRDALQKMSIEEITTFIDDVSNYDNPEHVWKSRLKPALPFETWKDWLDREADYGINE